MSRRGTDYSLEERLQAVESVVNYYQSVSQVSKIFEISWSTLDSSVYKYQEKGIEGLKASRNQKR